jgi:hypothetical protein
VGEPRLLACSSRVVKLALQMALARLGPGRFTLIFFLSGCPLHGVAAGLRTGEWEHAILLHSSSVDFILYDDVVRVGP